MGCVSTNGKVDLCILCLVVITDSLMLNDEMTKGQHVDNKKQRAKDKTWNMFVYTCSR